MTDYQYVTKLIKLANGDDVVGEVDIASLKTSEIKVKNPQRIVTLTNQTHMGMAFVKWVPWNYGDRIPVNKRHVVTVCNTHPVVLDYYKKTNDKIKNYKPRTKVEAAATMALLVGDMAGDMFASDICKLEPRINT